MPQSIADGALPWQRLAVVNKHPRDDNISFEESTHTYSIDGDSTGWKSCTTIISHLYKHFDPDAIIAKMRQNKEKFAVGPYYGKTDEEIKAGWNANGATASEAGTRMHLDIEHYYNSDPVGNLAGDNYEPLESPEWTMFLEYQRKIGSKFKPYRTEWLVWDKSVMIAGSIDMVYENPDGTLAIYDWKRSKDITRVNNFNKYALTESICHMPDSNFWHYALQLNTYKAILEQKYDKKITDLYLVRLHPDNDEKTYELIKLPILSKEISDLFSERLQEITNAC